MVDAAVADVLQLLLYFPFCLGLGAHYKQPNKAIFLALSVYQKARLQISLPSLNSFYNFENTVATLKMKH